MFQFKTDKQSKQVLLSMNKLAEQNREAIEAGFFELGDDLVRTAENQAFNEPKKGRTYLNVQDAAGRIIKEKHRASAPGQSPAVVTGEYVDSFGYQVSGGEKMVFGNSADHAKELEEGRLRPAPGESFMEPRPGLGNAVEANIRNGQKIFERQIEKHLAKQKI